MWAGGAQPQPSKPLWDLWTGKARPPDETPSQPSFPLAHQSQPPPVHKIHSGGMINSPPRPESGTKGKNEPNPRLGQSKPMLHSI